MVDGPRDWAQARLTLARAQFGARRKARRRRVVFLGGAPMPSLDFWYEFASTYSYPAAMRVEGIARQRGAAVRWRPFLLGPLFAEAGWRDSP